MFGGVTAIMALVVVVAESLSIGVIFGSNSTGVNVGFVVGTLDKVALWVSIWEEPLEMSF